MTWILLIEMKNEPHPIPARTQGTVDSVDNAPTIQIENQLYVQAIKDYFKSRPDVRKLLKYGKTFGIGEKIRTYMEVL